MAEVKHILRHWRGNRAGYNLMKQAGMLDSWTEYSVLEANGIYVRYFGENRITEPTGQLLPVISILSEAPNSEDVNPGDRYLIGTDETGYKIYTYTVGDNNSLVVENSTFDEKYGVRVKEEGYKNYIYVNGELKTYDDVDCGIF